MGKHLEHSLPSVYTLQCLTGKVDNNSITVVHRCPSAGSLGRRDCVYSS